MRMITLRHILTLPATLSDAEETALGRKFATTLERRNFTAAGVPRCAFRPSHTSAIPP